MTSNVRDDIPHDKCRGTIILRSQLSRELAQTEYQQDLFTHTYCWLPAQGSNCIIFWVPQPWYPVWADTNTWWRHQMETFSALLAICADNSPVPGEFPAQRPVTRSIDVFFDLRLNKRLSKESWGWWFETPSHPLWRNRNELCSCYFVNSVGLVHHQAVLG